MSVGLDHPEVTRFLARLDEAAAALPPGRREELVAEIRDHLRDALSVGAGDEAALRETLDRLGDPADIVAAEADGAAPAAAAPATPATPVWQTGPPGQEPWPAPRVSPWGGLEIAAVLLLTAGTVVVPVVGPLVGLVLAWVSERWTHREKVVATVLTLLPVAVLVAGARAVLVAVPTSTSTTFDSTGSTAVVETAPAAPAAPAVTAP
ncbi:MAG: hypothetical protein HY830_00890 [Actinobacteria bacterium]|nr:hypothetical protein [Actinomycetota bacterium]